MFASAQALGGQTRDTTAEGEPSPRKPPFRVLYSNDATNITSCPSPFNPEAGPFKPEFLLASIDETAGMGVDVHMLQPGMGWVPWWPSDVYPMAEHAKFVNEQHKGRISSWDRFVLGGGDVVRLFIDRCRARGMAPFISYRLNDWHHIFRNVGIEDPVEREAAMGVCRFYSEHPEFRMGPGVEENANYQYLQDWIHPDVREYKFRLIEELCRNYDFDGLELDFMRHSKFSRLDKTTAEQRAAILTDFAARVRTALDKGSKPNQRRWLCARVPNHLGSHAGLGIDLAGMAAAGVDMMNLSGHYFTDMSGEVAAARAQTPSNVSIYHEMHYVIVQRPSTKQARRTTQPMFCTAAHLTYARGGDGVSTFNFQYYRGSKMIQDEPHEPPFAVLQRLGDRQWLARQPQHYAIGCVTSSVLLTAPGHPANVLNAQIHPGGTIRPTLDMAPPEGGWKKEARMRIQAMDSLGDSQWQARFNGAALPPTGDVSEPYPNPYPVALGNASDYRAWSISPHLLRDGANEIEIAMTQGSAARLFYLDIAAA